MTAGIRASLGGEAVAAAGIPVQVKLKLAGKKNTRVTDGSTGTRR